MINWNDSSDRDLLLSIITECAPAIKWDAVVASMIKKGYDTTDRACTQHFAKLKKDQSVSGTPSKKTPGTKSKATTNGKTATPKKKTARPDNSKKRKSAVADEPQPEDDDDSEENWADAREFNAAKKVKKGSAFKAEDNDDDRKDAWAAFKMENRDEEGGRQTVDLENDELYDEESTVEV